MVLPGRPEVGVLDGERPTVLLAAAGAGWEPAALAVLASALPEDVAGAFR